MISLRERVGVVAMGSEPAGGGNSTCHTDGQVIPYPGSMSGGWRGVSVPHCLNLVVLAKRRGPTPPCNVGASSVHPPATITVPST